MGWLISLAVISLLAALPLGVSARYDGGGALVRVTVGPVKLTVFPRPKRPKAAKKTREKKPQEEPEEEKKQAEPLAKPPQPPQPPKHPKAGSPLDFLPLVKTGLELLGDLRRKLRVDLCMFRVTLAGGDPSDLAVNYGRVCAVVANLIPLLDRAFVIKQRDIHVYCDFAGEGTSVAARLDLTLTLGRLLSLGVRYGLRALLQFLSIQKSRKGGAVS